MRTNVIARIGLSLILLVSAAACGGGGGGGSGDGGRDPGSAPSNAGGGGTGTGGGGVGIGVPGGGGAAGVAAFSAEVYPLTRQYCVQCHVGAGPGFPHIAHPDAETAFRAVVDNQKVNLVDPSRSRLVQRLATDRHFCWSNCANDAAMMQAAIQVWADAVGAQAPPDPNNPGTVIPATIISSDGRSFGQASLAESGRSEQDIIAYWKLEEGSGEIALDTSSVGPTMNLTLSGDVDWVSGGGLAFDGGKAQATATDSRKLYNELASGSGSQRYSIETWVIPANTTQEGPARIMAYSLNNSEANFMLGQVLYNYVFRNRNMNPAIEPNGNPALSTADADEDLQAQLQHVVVQYDQNNGRRIWVNGVFTDDVDEIAPDNMFNWDPDYMFVVGNDVNNNRPWRGTVKMIAIRNALMSQNQIMTNFLAGASQRFTLRFGLDAALGNGAWVQFTVSEFDAYSYLFCAPLLNTNGRTGFSVQTVRIAVNGIPPVASQSFRLLNANITQTSTQLTEQCSVVPKDLGAEQDVFHVFFDVLGDLNQPIADIPASPPPVVPVDEPSPGTGIRDFAEINDTMSVLTGVPSSNAATRATYAELIQQLPGDNDVRAFVSAQQVGISRLALDYCDQLVETTALRNAFFGTGTAFDFTDTADVAFTTIAQRDAVITPLANKMMGTSLTSQPSAAEVRPALDTLIDQLTAGCTAATCPASHTRNVVKGVCAAVLSSAAAHLH